MKECPGCHFPMSLTEAERGQHWCNRCESLTLSKLCAAMRQYDPSRQGDFDRMPVPEHDSFGYLSWQAGEIVARRSRLGVK